MQRRVEVALEKAFQNHVPLKMGFLFLRKFCKETHQLYGESNAMGQEVRKSISRPLQKSRQNRMVDKSKGYEQR